MDKGEKGKERERDGGWGKERGIRREKTERAKCHLLSVAGN